MASNVDALGVIHPPLNDVLDLVTPKNWNAAEEMGCHF